VDLKFPIKDDIETDIEELGKKLTKRFKAFVLSMERFNSNLRTWKISCKRSRGL
jgi:hypothetical protein